MGEIHKASLDGLKLEGAAKDYAPILAFFFGPLFTLFVAFSQKDEKLKSAVLKAGIVQWIACLLCYIGWIWCIMWALAAKKQS